jgi:hypothetical protein
VSEIFFKMGASGEYAKLTPFSSISPSRTVNSPASGSSCAQSRPRQDHPACQAAHAGGDSD